MNPADFEALPRARQAELKAAEEKVLALADRLLANVPDAMAIVGCTPAMTQVVMLAIAQRATEAADRLRRL